MTDQTTRVAKNMNVQPGLVVVKPSTWRAFNTRAMGPNLFTIGQISHLEVLIWPKFSSKNDVSCYLMNEKKNYWIIKNDDMMQLSGGSEDIFSFSVDWDFPGS